MSLSAEDARAIASGARELGVDPRVLGGLMELESNVDPNIIGGAGKKYRGLIQFGPDARREVGLPDGPMSIAQQMPYVVKYFGQRGFKPGTHGATELYRTVLVGNPNQSGTDSFGTNSDQAARRMMPGGDLYKRFAARFDPAIGSPGGPPAALSSPAASTTLRSDNNPLASLMKGLAGDVLSPGSFNAPSTPPTGRAQRQPSGAPASNNVRRLQLKNEIISGLLGRAPGRGGIAPIGGAVDRLAGDALADAFSPARRSGSIATTGGSGGDMAIDSSINGLIAGIFAPKGAAAQERATGGGGMAAQGGTGGARVVEYLTGDKSHSGYDASHGGSNYHEHMAFGSRAERDAAMKLLKSQGIQIGSVNDGKHAPGSYHYSDQAFDVPASQVPVGQEQALSRRVREILKGGGFQGL
jgi:hypothetical protein